MPNKDWNKLNELDRLLHQTFPTQMWTDNQTICTIRMFGGFELFNTRPYHNYENWSSGYEVTSPLYPDIRIIAEDLDDAIKLFNKEVEKIKGKNGDLEKGRN